MENNTINSFEVLIIGAGAAGLMAARELSAAGKKVAVLEARSHMGGRAHTIADDRFSIPVELGAEFVHGQLPLTLKLLQEGHIPYHKVAGSLWRATNGQLEKEAGFIEHYNELLQQLQSLTRDISVADFVQQYLGDEKWAETRASLKSYVEGYYAADTAKASTFALRQELTTSDDVDYRIEGGYRQLINFLGERCRSHGCRIFLSSPVTHIHWQKGNISVKANGTTYTATKAIITVPLGVLQALENDVNYIHFSPTINDKIAAARQLGFGSVIKILLQFKDVFWNEKGLQQMSFLFSTEPIPTWWTQYPNDIPLLTGWLAGPSAARFKNRSEEEMLQKSLLSLSHIFDMPATVLQQKLVASHIADWGTDPFCNGGYAYQTVNGAALRQQLKEPQENTLFFAGEAFLEGPEIGTVEAALASGREAAAQLLAAF